MLRKIRTHYRNAESVPKVNTTPFIAPTVQGPRAQPNRPMVHQLRQAAAAAVTEQNEEATGGEIEANQMVSVY